MFPLRPSRVDMCQKLVPPGGTLLDAGCGTGALVRAISKRGIDVWGFDLDPGFVARARAELMTESARVVLGDLVGIGSVFPEKRFDAIVCLGQTFPHLLADSEVHAFLRGAGKRLVTGGRLVLQVVSDRDDRPDRILPVLEASGTKLHRRRILTGADRAELRLSATGEAGDVEWKVVHRRWTPESLGRFAETDGYQVSAVVADESGAAWTGAESGWLMELALA